MVSDDTYELYSKRLARQARGDAPVPYQYDNLSSAFRQQVIFICRRALGGSQMFYDYDFDECFDNPIWESIHDLIAEEYGLPYLGNQLQSYGERCESFLLTASVEPALDIIEVSFRTISHTVPNLAPRDVRARGITQHPNAAVKDLNRRFREHVIGYQFIDNHIIRVDSQFVYTEMVEPAITLLHDARFAGPSDEFMKAHEHYRHGRYKEATRDALNAAESTIKAICDRRGWSRKGHESAGGLIALVMNHGLIPHQFRQQFIQMEQLLTGLATVRNTSGGMAKARRS